MGGPDWTDDNPRDPGLAILDLFAYLGDALTWYQDRASDEAQLRTRRYAVALAVLLTLLFIRRRRRPDD
jgi:MYXO-CTERM domain-containing protein